jgi:RNAse (barnase) inhibitor barstar
MKQPAMPSRGIFFLPTEQACAATLSVDLGRCTTAAGVLRKLGSALELPDWYGNNFDALFDCLSDPEWHAASPLILRLYGLRKLQERQPDDCATLIEVLGAAEARSNGGAALAIVVDLPFANGATWPAS